MLVGVISDTHGDIDPRLPDVFAGVDCILHAGDIGSPAVLDALAAIAPIFAIRGNADRDLRLTVLPERLDLNLSGTSVQLVHRLQDARPRPETRVLVHGHSHKAEARRSGPILYLNPGAAGRQGFHTQRTAALLHLDEQAEASMIALGPKGRDMLSSGRRAKSSGSSSLGLFSGIVFEEAALISQDGAADSVGGRRWPEITIYTTSWCGDCRASKRFLTRHGVPFTEFDIEAEPSKADVVVRLNNGMRRVPTIVIGGGPTLVEPSDLELGRALGIA